MKRAPFSFSPFVVGFLLFAIILGAVYWGLNFSATGQATLSIPPRCALSEISCSDGTDNDCDGFVDCQEAQCVADPACQNPAPVCGNGIVESPEQCEQSAHCGSGMQCENCTCVGNGTPACADGIDNDGDGLTDWQYDMGCATQTDSSEGGLANGTYEDGWMVFEKSPDTRIIYVSSSSGNDTWNGLAPEWSGGTNGPKQSIDGLNGGVSLLRHGYPDWMLLKRGDTFPSSLRSYHSDPTRVRWQKGGRSASEPLIVGSYGPSTQRPQLIPLHGNSCVSASGGGGTPSPLQHLVFQGFECYLATQDPTSPAYVGSAQADGISWNVRPSSLVVQDVAIRYADEGISLSGTPSAPITALFNGVVVTDSYSADGDHAQGLYSTANHVTIQRSYFIHNGGNANVPGGALTIFNRNAYFQADSASTVLEDNLFADSDCVQMRAGGTAVRNVFARCTIGLLLAGGNNQTNSTIAQNVFLDGQDINPSDLRRQAIQIGNIQTADVSINENILANTIPADGTAAFKFIVIDDTPPGSGITTYFPVRNVTLSNNIVHNWGGEAVSISNFGTHDVEFSGIHFVNNRFLNAVDAEPLISHADASTVEGIAWEGTRLYSAFNQSTPLINSHWIRAPDSMSVREYMNTVGGIGTSAGTTEYPNGNRGVSTYHASLGKPATHESYILEARQQSRLQYQPEYSPNALLNYIRTGYGLASVGS